MSNFQAAAAMAMQAQMSRGKNQVGSVSDNTQMQQIQQISAPAVGALAPLVMPVPDYESANTLKQALESINSFGNFAQQRGAWLGGIKNDQEYQVHLEKQKQAQEKQQQAQIANNALSKFKQDQATDVLIGFDITEANKNPGSWAANKTAPYLEGITDQSIRQNLTAEIQMGLARQFASSKIDAKQLANEAAIEQHRKTNEFQKSWNSELEIETNGKTWKQTLERESEQPQAWIENRVTQGIKGLKDGGVTDASAIESFRSTAVQKLSSEINPFVKQKITETENENLKAVGTAITVGKREISVDEIASQTGKSKQYVIENLLPTLAESAAINKDSELMKRVMNSIPAQDKLQNEPIIQRIYDKEIANQKNKIANINESIFAEAVENPNSKDAINKLEQTPIIDYEGRSLNSRFVETYALNLMKSNPGNMENIIRYENKITSEIGKQQYETIRNHAGKQYEENTAEWIRQQLRSGAATPETTMATIKERASKWVFGVEGAEPLSPGRQILGSLSPTTVKQLEGEMGSLIVSKTNIEALNEHIKSNFTSVMTTDTKKGATEQRLLDGSPIAIKFAMDNGTVMQGAINNIYTNSLDEKGNVKDPEQLLEISQLNIQFEGAESDQTRRFWGELKDIANSPNKYSPESKKILIEQAQKRFQLNKADTTTIEEKDFADAKKIIGEVNGIDNKTSNDIMSKAWANGESNNDGGSFWWSANDTYDSMRETRTLSGNDVKQINGDFAKIYLNSTDQSEFGLTKAWNKAMENAKQRYQPIKINGKVVGRVDQTNEPAWSPAAESQLNEDFGEGKIANISYQGIAEESHIYIVTGKDFQSHYWKEDTEKSEKTRQEQIKQKRQEIDNKFLKNQERILMEDRPGIQL